MVSSIGWAVDVAVALGDPVLDGVADVLADVLAVALAVAVALVDAVLVANALVDAVLVANALVDAVLVAVALVDAVELDESETLGALVPEGEGELLDELVGNQDWDEVLLDDLVGSEETKGAELHVGTTLDDGELLDERVG